MIQIRIQEQNASPRMHLNYKKFEEVTPNKHFMITMSYEDIKSNYAKLGLIIKNFELKRV
jgi:hypothetical protein